jgi:hypothetical protein
MLAAKETKKAATRRSRRGVKKAGAIASATGTAAEKTAKTVTPKETAVIEDATIVEEAVETVEVEETVEESSDDKTKK